MTDETQLWGCRAGPQTNALKCPFPHHSWPSQLVPWKRIPRPNHLVMAQNPLGAPLQEVPSERGHRPQEKTRSVKQCLTYLPHSSDVVLSILCLLEELNPLQGLKTYSLPSVDILEKVLDASTMKEFQHHLKLWQDG